MPLLSPREIKTTAQLRQFQRVMTTALFRPLTSRNRMQARWLNGRSTAAVVSKFIKPNDRLTSFERLEIYNRQYWFRILDSFYDDFPGLRAVLGERTFMKMAEAYLLRYPSTTFTMRNLGLHLKRFLSEEPQWTGKKLALALDVVRFEWAQIEAFDAEATPPAGISELLLTDPARLKFVLQPHIKLLEFAFPVDDFIIGVKQGDSSRGDASNAADGAPQAMKLKKIPLPKRKRTYVAVHRHNNALYYKRLEPEAFVLLRALSKGATLEVAFSRAVFHASRRVNWGKEIEGWFENWSKLGWFYSRAIIA
jgi:hypothetical protein